MIKINLLPHSKKTRLSATEKQIVLGLGLIAGLLVLFTGLILWSGSKVADLEEKVQAQEEKRQKLLDKVGEVNELEEKMEEMESNLKAIKEIRSIQQLPVRYVEALIQGLPGQRIWFESLNLNNEDVLEIRGVAADNQIFAQYVDNLRESGYIHKVETKRTSRRQIQDMNLVEFDFQIQAGPSKESPPSSPNSE